VVLAVQVMAAAYAGVMDFRYPFSPAGEAADFIRHQNRQDDAVIGPVAISALLDRDVYFATERRQGRFRIWSRFQAKLLPGELIQLAKEVGAAEGKRVLLVVGKPLDDPQASASVKKLAQFTEGLIRHDRYFIYSLGGEAGTNIKTSDVVR